jgi:UDP-glucose:tetrahydrobiopterin glucosyltransferase
MKLLLMSTSVGPLGSGLGGGVELTLRNLAIEMRRRGHQIQVVAPAGSELMDFPIAQIPGQLQVTAQTQEIPCPPIRYWEACGTMPVGCKATMT